MELRISPHGVTIEPSIFFIASVQGMMLNLRTQYIEFRLAENHNHTLANIATGNTDCGVNATNRTVNEIETHIQAETALWILYMKVISMTLPWLTGEFSL